MPPESLISAVEKILLAESQLVHHAPAQFGKTYDIPLEFIDVFSADLFETFNQTADIFVSLYPQVRNHLLLAWLSTLRRHRTQAWLNMRHAIEFGNAAAFALAHNDGEFFASKRADGTLDAHKGLVTKRNRWIAKNFPPLSSSLKQIKDDLNENSCHANVIIASLTSRVDEVKQTITSRFFDHDDAFFVRVDLWQIGHISALILKLFVEVNTASGFARLSPAKLAKAEQLREENFLLQEELLAHSRMQR